MGCGMGGRCDVGLKQVSVEMEEKDVGGFDFFIMEWAWFNEE